MEKKQKNKKDKRIIDVIVMLILAGLVISMSVFAATREASNQEIILMEIYKSSGPETSTASINHYYIYSNTNTVEIRSSNTSVTKKISQDSIAALTNSLNEYISQNPTINTAFYINERYTIEFNGTSITVPNPDVSTLLGYDSSKYYFYNIVEEFINTINN